MRYELAASKVRQDKAGAASPHEDRGFRQPEAPHLANVFRRFTAKNIKITHYLKSGASGFCSSSVAAACLYIAGRSYGAEIIFDVVLLQTGRSYGAENNRGRWGLQTRRSYGAKGNRGRCGLQTGRSDRADIIRFLGVRPRKARSGAEQRRCSDVCLIGAANAGRSDELAGV